MSELKSCPNDDDKRRHDMLANVDSSDDNNDGDEESVSHAKSEVDEESEINDDQSRK